MLTPQTTTSSPSKMTVQVTRTLLINGLAPYLIFIALKGQLSDFMALILSALPPLLESLWTLGRRRRLDVMATLVLGGIALGLILMLVGGNARLLLVRESLVTGVIGLAFLGTLLLRRPLVFYLAREMAVGSDPDGIALWESHWQRRGFRKGMQVMTLAWGAGLALEAALRVDMAETLSTETFLAASPFVQYGITGGLIAWNVWYVRRMKARGGAVEG